MTDLELLAQHYEITEYTRDTRYGSYEVRQYQCLVCRRKWSPPLAASLRPAVVFELLDHARTHVKRRLARVSRQLLAVCEPDERIARKRKLRDAVHPPSLKIYAGEHPAFTEEPRP